jgi:3-phenylpropionate/trans-cinnamate dioxygenase ferredoxin reductase subunit
MAHYNYIIIGAGMTGDAAVKGIRTIDTKGSIAIIGSEKDKPYDRPLLSKKLWKGEAFDKIWRHTPEKDLHFYLGRTATAIDPHTKRVTIDKSEEISFDKLLIATGGIVRTLPMKAEGIIYFRTAEDYRNLRSLTESKNNFLVIGGGFIGTEIAAALAMNDKKVTMIFPEGSIGERNYPKSLSDYITGYYKQKGVTVYTEDGISAITGDVGNYLVKTKSGKELHFDGIVAGIGIQPDIELAKQAGLGIDNGITVDEYCTTTDPNIYAAGDVANFYNPALDKRVRLEHEDNANVMGECAGKNMAGGEIKYEHLPYFYSDLFDLGYEAIGEMDSRHETVTDWKEENKEGVIYYLSGERVRGVLLWNVWEQVPNARALIAAPGPYTKENVKGIISI